MQSGQSGFMGLLCYLNSFYLERQGMVAILYTHQTAAIITGIISIYRGENWGTKSLIHFSRYSELVKGRLHSKAEIRNLCHPTISPFFRLTLKPHCWPCAIHALAKSVKICLFLITATLSFWVDSLKTASPSGLWSQERLRHGVENGQSQPNV